MKPQIVPHYGVKIGAVRKDKSVFWKEDTELKQIDFKTISAAKLWMRTGRVI